MKLFRLLTLSYLKKRPFYFFLTLLAMALGLSVYAAISLANRSVVSALEKEVQSSTGGISYSVFAKAGKLKWEDLYFLSSQKEVLKASPVSQVKLACGKEFFTLNGFDFLTRPAQQFQNAISLQSFGEGDKDTIWMTEGLAKLCQISEDSSYNFIWDKNGISLPVHVLKNEGSLFAFTDMAVMEKFFSRGDEFDRIDLLFSEKPSPHPESAFGGNPLLKERGIPSPWGEGAPRADEGREQFGNYRFLSPQELTSQNQNLTSAFRTNLQAMSGVAVLVAVFLVYNALSLSFFHRRSQFATLLCLGAKASQIAKSLILEVLLFSLLSTGLGYFLGLFLAQKLMLQISGTLSSLYHFQISQSLAFSWQHFAETLGVALFSCGIGAALPFLELRSLSPILATRNQNYENRFKTLFPYTVLSSVFCVLLFAFCLHQVSGEKPYWGIFSTLLLILSFTSFTPLVFFLSFRLFIFIFRKLRWAKALLVSNQISQNPYRFSVILAALSVALSLWLGMSFMVNSFRSTLEVWVKKTIKADLYLTSKIHDENFIPQELIPSDEKGKWKRISIRHLQGFYQNQAVEISISNLKEQMQLEAFEIKEGTREDFIQSPNQNLVALAEPFANRFKLGVGDSFEIETHYGPQLLYVAAVLYDYTSERGLIYLDRDDFLRWAGDERVHGIAFHLQDLSQKEKLKAELEQIASKLNSFEVRSQEEIWQQVLQIFDQTFRVTVALKFLALVVSMLGVWASLLILSEENRKEMGLLQILGLSRFGMLQVLLIQSLLFASIATFLGTLSGSALSYVLLKVIHRYYFGWTLFFNFYWMEVLQAFALTFVASFLAGALVQWKMHKEALASLVRNEE